MASERVPLFRRDEMVVIATAFLLVIVLLFPFLWLVTLSLKTNRDIFAWPPRLLFEPTLANYAALWDTGFVKSYLNSAIVSVSSTVLALLIGVPAAYALSRAGMRHERSLSLAILTKRMAPPITFTIPNIIV